MSNCNDNEIEIATTINITIQLVLDRYGVVTYLNPPDLEAVLGAGVLEGGMHDVFVSD